MTDIIDVEAREIDPERPVQVAGERKDPGTRNAPSRLQGNARAVPRPIIKKYFIPKDSALLPCDNCLYKKKIRDNVIKKKNDKEKLSRMKKENRGRIWDRVREFKIGTGGYAIPVILLILPVLLYWIWPVGILIIMLYMLLRGPEYDF